MALFNKKKTQTPASPTAPATTSAGGSSSDDFSDFSPEALDAAADATGDAAAGKKGRKVGRDKKSPSGRAIKPGVAIGLNIGSDSIKVIELQAKGSEMAITGMGMVPTPPESISNGVVMSAHALVSGIREVLAQAGIKSKKVVTSISGTGALVVRIIEVPKMSDGELLDNMKMDADRYIPFPPSEVEMDFTALRELPSDPDSPNMEVLLAAAQREVIDLHVQVLQDAKLDPRSIDVEPLAAARALTHPLVNGINGLARSAANGNGATNGAATEEEVDYNDVAAILNIGASGTEISILRGDLLVFTRTVPTAGNALTQALVDTLGLAWSDAEQLKREMGDALAPSGDTNATGSSFVPSASPDLGWTEPAVDNEDSGEPWDDADTVPENTAYPSDAVSDNYQDTVSDVPNAGTAPGNVASGDPFADDFYEQGPDNIRQTEPGEQHQQKQPDDTPSGKADSPFNFDEIDSSSGTDQAEVEELPTFEGSTVGTEGIADDRSTPGADEELILPSTATPGASAGTPAQNPVTPQGSPASQSTPAAGVDPENPFFDFGHAGEPEDKLPDLQEGKPVSFADFLTEEEDNLGDLPTLRDDSPPSTAVPSAFEFPLEGTDAPDESAPQTTDADDIADFSLPTFGGELPATESLTSDTRPDPQEESVLPSESKTSSGSNAFSFSFEDSLIATPPPSAPPSAAPTADTPAETDPFAEFMASAEPTPPTTPPTITRDTAPAPSPVANAAPSTPPPAADDFDLDSLFDDTTTGAGSSAPTSGDSLDFGGLDVGGDDFGMDDAAFGVGLAGAAVGEIDAATLHSVLEPVLDNLVNEVRRSLEYHTTRYPNAAVRRVVITGGGARLTNVDAYFTQKLGIPTTIGNPVSRMVLRAPNLPSEYADENGPLFTVALGLAMRELTR